ncbi:hypothetical protein [uncultured Pseudoteredinibacter sp.]|uniref:hypothetical protein n=1 Tax=uncultured Pseudoteredinibacter sp. TaxID=1641701 RepID=UPI0026100EFB|nr:hypothetical protein [uncultured Pseudoteredinibacter sp.]
MDQYRPFFTQLQLAKCQCKAVDSATLPLEKLSFLRGGFLIIQAMCDAWLLHETPEQGAEHYPNSLSEFNRQGKECSVEFLPASIIQLQQSDWFDDFLKIMSLVEDLNDSMFVEQNSPVNVIAVSEPAPQPSLSSLKAAILNFEQYFDAQMKLSEEY